jgi:post-segregation antitoxin (ccd killing protein)
MPKLSVYVPEDLYDDVRRHGIAVSTVAQSALETAVAEQANRAWAERARRRPTNPVAMDTSALLAEVRDEFGA